MVISLRLNLQTYPIIKLLVLPSLLWKISLIGKLLHLLSGSRESSKFEESTDPSSPLPPFSFIKNYLEYCIYFSYLHFFSPKVEYHQFDSNNAWWVHCKNSL